MTSNGRALPLSRCAVSPRRGSRTRCVPRVAAAALLVAGGVIGQRIADAIADADRWNERYELLMLIDVFASKHPRAISCDHALAQLRAGVGPNPRDAWERAYSVGCVIDSGQPIVYVVSAGPDGKLGTPDDLVGVQAVEP